MPESEKKDGKKEEKKEPAQVKILVIEDSPQVLRFIEVMLIRRGFNVLAARDGIEGVQTALREIPDLILLDIGLPKLNGFEVLKALKSRKVTKEIPVLATTNFNEKESIINAIRLGVGDYMIKPVPQKVLFARVEKALKKAGKQMPRGHVDEDSSEDVTENALLDEVKDKPIADKINYILDKSDTLVALPFVVSKVLKVTQDASAGAKQLAKAISSDAAITAVVLRRANSSYYGAREEISNISEAVVRIGFNDTRSLVLGLSFMKFLSSKGKSSGLGQLEFWMHSLAVASCSRILAAAAGINQIEEAFTAGLLHDLGKIILAEYLPKEYTSIFETCRQKDFLIRDVEKEKLTMGHHQVGAKLAKNWQLPAEIYEAIRHHHNPARAKNSPITKIVHLADAIAKVLGIGFAGDLYIEDTPTPIWENFELKQGIDSAMIKKVGQEIIQAREFLDISDEDLKKILKPAPFAGEVVFSDFTLGDEHLVKILLRNMGYHTRAAGDHEKLVERLSQKQYAHLFAILGSEKDIEFVKELDSNLEIKKPERVTLFYNEELSDKMDSSELPWECYMLPFSSRHLVKTLTAE